MKSLDEVGVTFVNRVLGSGIFNGVVNIQFGVFQFTTTESSKVDPDIVVCSRLRMDIECATMLRDTLDNLLSTLNVPPAVRQDDGAGVVMNGSSVPSSEKPN